MINIEKRTDVPRLLRPDDSFIIEYDLATAGIQHILAFEGESCSIERAFRNALMYALRKAKAKPLLESTWLVQGENMGKFQASLNFISGKFSHMDLTNKVWIHPVLKDEKGFKYIKIQHLVSE